MITTTAEEARRLECVVRVLQGGGTMADAAEELGLIRSTLVTWWRNRNKSRNSREIDPAILEAMAAAGTTIVPSVTWAKTKNPDGTSYSVLLRPPVEEVASFAEQVRDALEGMEPAAPVAAPEQVMSNLCSLYPIMDAHIGMYASGRETGSVDYNLELAASDMRGALEKVMMLTPPAEQAILLLDGDTLHANGNRAETQKSKNALDVAGRFWEAVALSIPLIGWMAERLLAKHQSVRVRVMRGNHDDESHMTIAFALAERYRNDPRIVVECDPRDLFMYQWGRCGIFAHHGDKMKFQQMFNLLAGTCPWWSEAPHRHYVSGHYHREASVDIGGMRLETLRPFCPPDAYGAMWPSRRVMQSMTFDKQDGLVLRAYDPVERAA